MLRCARCFAASRRDAGSWGVVGSWPRCCHPPQPSSIPRQVALAVKALQRYRLGTDMSLFATDQFAADPNAAYPGYPTGSGIESTETYQSPPFTETLDANPKGYQVPAY